MKIEVISCWYKEQFFAGLFYNHYSWVDKITLITEVFPTGMDDWKKMEVINQAYRKSDADWVLVLDSDEFVYPAPYGTSSRAAIELEHASGHEVIVPVMHNVWRHASDIDVDHLKPPVPQRIHGDPDLVTGNNKNYTKPCVLRTGLPLMIGIGCHNLHPSRDLKYSPNRWAGAHWANADPSFCIARRRDDRNARLSPRNREAGAGMHQDFTTEQLLGHCRDHWNDPIVIKC